MLMLTTTLSRVSLIVFCRFLAVGKSSAVSWAPTFWSASSASSSLHRSKYSHNRGNRHDERDAHQHHNLHIPTSFAPPRKCHAGARRVRRTKIIAAAIMSSPDDTNTAAAVGGGSSSHPNWRVVDVHDDAGERTSCSPFCHPSSETSPSTASAAPWSTPALRSALDLYERMKTCTDPYIAPVLESALHDMEMAYRLYGPFCMVGSYNGGKDAVVIFHVMRAVHAHYCSEMRVGGDADDGTMMIPRPRVIYFQHPDEFPEVLSLLDDTVERFDVDMLAFKEGVSFGEGLKYLVERNISPGKDGLSFHRNSERMPPPHPLAFVLGTRKNDPNAGSQGIYAPSSHYMPPFLRVNPILDWTYGHVWHFLRLFELPYCSLYDDGYTSLGTVKDTLPCPALKKNDGDEEYWPAYMLKDWDLERAGRVDKKKAKSKLASQTGDGKVEDAPAHTSDVTMSQTSSTVSLPTDENETKPTASISTILNVDDDVRDSGAKTDVVSSNQLSCLGRPTVGLIVIGDELLKGMTPDSNIISAAKALRSNNISLSRVSIISDDGQDIADEIRRFKNEVDFIITSGGIGPTHDDVTIKSVAEALGLDLALHYPMAELLLDKMRTNSTTKSGCDDDNSEKHPKRTLIRQLSEGQVKMATLPTSSELQYLTDDSEEWPVLQCQNIFILPGVPAYFDSKINLLAASSKLAQPTTIGESKDEEIGLSMDQSAETDKQQSTPPPRSDTYRIVLSLEEDNIVSALNASVAAHPHVSFGSYPIVNDPEYKTIITLEGRFYNGGYRGSGSQKLLEKSEANDIKGKKETQSLFFSKEEMDKNVESALSDLKTRLPEEGILCIDSCDDLRIK